jgi:tRNA (guanine37-N1)-methyltransferase
MVMMCQPIFDAVQAIELLDSVAPVRVMLSPQGERLTQPRVEWLAQQPHVLLLCGHYEGIDERVVEELAPLELSLGDYVLSGGELGAMVLIDAVARLQPGVLGHEDSAAEDSFSVRAANGAPLLDCPHYTRPREWNGRAVPDVLLNGDHQAISRWRDAQRMERTRTRRPDLLLETTTQTQVQSQVQSHSLETRPLTTDTERTLVQHKSVDQVDRPNRSSLTSEQPSADFNTHTGLQGHNAPENA